MTLADRRRYASPQEGEVYELRRRVSAEHPETGKKIVFTHALAHGQDISRPDEWRFDLLREADQPQTPRDYEQRYDEPWARYGIMYHDHDVHEYVKLPPAPDDDMTSFAKALNTALADGERARRRAERTEHVRRVEGEPDTHFTEIKVDPPIRLEAGTSLGEAVERFEQAMEDNDG